VVKVVTFEPEYMKVINMVVILASRCRPFDHPNHTYFQAILATQFDKFDKGGVNDHIIL